MKQALRHMQHTFPSAHRSQRSPEHARVGFVDADILSGDHMLERYAQALLRSREQAVVDVRDGH